MKKRMLCLKMTMGLLLGTMAFAAGMSAEPFVLKADAAKEPVPGEDEVEKVLDAWKERYPEGSTWDSPEDAAKKSEYSIVNTPYYRLEGLRDVNAYDSDYSGLGNDLTDYPSGFSICDQFIATLENSAYGDRTMYLHHDASMLAVGDMIGTQAMVTAIKGDDIYLAKLQGDTVHWSVKVSRSSLDGGVIYGHAAPAGEDPYDNMEILGTNLGLLVEWEFLRHTDTQLTWSSSDPSVATVDERELVAHDDNSFVTITEHSAGTTEIRAYARGYYAVYHYTSKGDNSSFVKAISIRDEGGERRYYENGKWADSKNGFVEYLGVTYCIVDGCVDTSANGLVQDPEHPDTWYYCAEGRAQTQYTGLAEYDGEWFYINRGKLDTTMAAYVKYDGGLFYVGAGRIMKEVSGLAQDPKGDDWYYLARGQAQTQYTGLAMYDGEWFYVVNGKLAEYYTGAVDYDGATFHVVNGMVR